jgi:hypothetical protein
VTTVLQAVGLFPIATRPPVAAAIERVGRFAVPVAPIAVGMAVLI